MPIQEHGAKETLLLNAQQVKQQRGGQQTLCLARLRLELNKKKKATVIKMKYPFTVSFVRLLAVIFLPNLKTQLKKKKKAVSGYNKKEVQTRP